MLVSESTTGMREAWPLVRRGRANTACGGPPRAWHLDLGPFSLTCELDEEGEGLIGTGG